VTSDETASNKLSTVYQEQYKSIRAGAGHSDVEELDKGLALQHLPTFNQHHIAGIMPPTRTIPPMKAVKVRPITLSIKGISMLGTFCRSSGQSSRLSRATT
jgi:hypothetical protein